MNIDAYTKTELKEQLGLIELHVKQNETDPNFCISCIEKHLDNISGLSKEGSSLKGGKTYKKLTKWVDGIRSGRFSVKAIASRARDFRKSLGGEISSKVAPTIKKTYNKEFFQKAYKGVK